MEQNEAKQRNSVAKEFEESLDRLQHLLEEDGAPEEQLEVKKSNTLPSVEESLKFDLDDWEDAIADIEQYFESKDK